MAQQQLFWDRTRPDLETVYTYYPDGAVVKAVNLRYNRRHYFLRSANVHNPLVNGRWRSPSQHSYTDHELDSAFTGTAYYTHISSGNSARRTGALGFENVDWYPVDYSTPQSLVGQVDIKALNKMRDEAVNVGVAIGERREMAQMAANTARRLVNGVRQLRRGNLSAFRTAIGLRPDARRSQPTRAQARDIASRAPALWLEHQYGWKPLMGDIHTAIDRYEDANYRDPTRLYSHVNASLSTRVEGRYKQAVFTGSATIDWRVDHTVKVRLDYSPEGDLAHSNFKSADEWGITNPLLIAWELVPFSFVADWFYPVGDYLSAITAAVPYRFRSGSRTIFRKAMGEATLDGPGSSGTFRIHEAVGRASMQGTFFQRYNINAFPVPSMSAVASMHHKDASDETVLTRFANAVSILASQMAGLDTQTRTGVPLPPRRRR